MPSVSCTTRSRRATEASGKCYDFVSQAEFDAMVARGDFLEYARVFGRHSYGTPKKWLEESRIKGLDLVLEIDVQGAAQVKGEIAGSGGDFYFASVSRRNSSGVCAAEVRIPTKKSRGAFRKHVKRSSLAKSFTIFV